MKKSVPIAFATILATLLVVGCEDEVTDAEVTNEEVTAAEPAKWYTAEVPDGEISDVADIKGSAKPGDQVMVRGKIGGQQDPITEDAGLFIIVDSSVVSCADMGEDHCPTPWDYCCEPTDSLAAKSATVQLREADGQMIRLEEGTLSPLEEVIVIGTVAPGTAPEALIIHAEQVAVQ